MHGVVDGPVLDGFDDLPVSQDDGEPELADDFAVLTVFHDVLVGAHVPLEKLVTRQQDLTGFFAGHMSQLFEECGRDHCFHADCGVWRTRVDTDEVVI